MRSLYTAVTVMTIAALTGCTQGTPGGPGMTGDDAKKPTIGQAEDTFNLSVPVMSSSLQQGTSTESTVGIKRAQNFDQDVSLKFAEVPTGVTIEPANPVIKSGDTDAKITFQAADDTAPGDYKVKVTGHPTEGSDAEVEFKLTIAPKDTFTLSVPLLSTSLKQGDKSKLTIGIKRDATFDQDIELTFGELPTGVTLDASASVIKHGTDEALITLTGASDASLGDFTIKVTGHPTVGADATNEFNLTVAKQE